MDKGLSRKFNIGSTDKGVGILTFVVLCHWSNIVRTDTSVTDRTSDRLSFVSYIIIYTTDLIIHY